MEEYREVETREALKLSKETGFKLFETSAKDNTGIEYMFTEIAKNLYESPPKSKRKDTVVVRKSNNQPEENKSFFSKLTGLC